MANLPIKTGAGDSAYLKSSGVGTDGTPYIPEHTAVQATHDNLCGNANLQVANADVGNANPVPVSDAGGTITVDDGAGSLTVDQAAHDNFNANANIQVGNADVGASNPVPVSDPNTYGQQYTTSADMSGGSVDLTPAPASGKKVCVKDLIVSAAAGMVLTLKEETSGTVIAAIAIPSGDTRVVNLSSRLKLAVADKKLQGQSSAAGNIYVTVVYYSEA